jgi:UPF0271 protein
MSASAWGFGRRRIDMKPRDLEYMVAYQIGALQAMASYAGLEVTHLKPHGALNNMAAENEDYAMAIGRAIKTVDKDIIYVALYGSQMQKAAEKLGLRLAREGFVDRKYDDDGNLASRAIPGTVLRTRRPRSSTRCAWCRKASSSRCRASASRSRPTPSACMATRRPA